jgi:hypothetical protein
LDQLEVADATLFAFERQPRVWTNGMAWKEFDESDNRTDVRYICGHPKHDRFAVRRLGVAAALLIAVAVILLIILPSHWLI